MKTLHLVALLPLLLASCASDKKTAAATPAPAHRSLNERLSGSGPDPDSFTQDAHGNFVSKSDKRSSFESKGESSYAKKAYKKQDYKTGDYATKSWWGNKDYGSKAYAGNTDGSRFQTKSRLQGQSAREAGTNAKIPDNYKTGDYATGAAHETGATPIKNESNYQIEKTRKTFPQPDVVDWREQRNMNKDQIKGILGN